MSAMLATTFTSCDSTANILKVDEALGLYAGDCEIQWIAYEDNVEFEGRTYQRGEPIVSYQYRMVEKDTCFVALSVSNTGNSNIAMLIPGEEEDGAPSAYYLEVKNIPVSELGNRVASVGVTDVPFGDNMLTTNTLYQRYKGAEFETLTTGKQVETDLVDGDIAFISGNYRLALQTSITNAQKSGLDGIGIVLNFDGWLLSGKDSNDLQKRRNKR